jgi:putative addiction module CopG family antidote
MMSATGGSPVDRSAGDDGDYQGEDGSPKSEPDIFDHRAAHGDAVERRPFRPFRMTPIPHDDGPTDVSINHDRSFADGELERHRRSFDECLNARRDTSSPARAGDLRTGMEQVSIELTPRSEALIRAKVVAGSYRSVDDLIEDALRALDEREEQRLLRLRALIEEGFASGEGIPFTAELMDEIEQEAEAAYRRGEEPNPGVYP